jgi:anti-anti-sigma regulatory factor
MTEGCGQVTLAAAHSRAQAEGREVLLVIPSPPVLRVFALTAMDRVIATFTPLTEAPAQTGAARPPPRRALAHRHRRGSSSAA